jgi:hypothetical protein
MLLWMYIDRNCFKLNWQKHNFDKKERGREGERERGREGEIKLNWQKHNCEKSTVVNDTQCVWYPQKLITLSDNMN